MNIFKRKNKIKKEYVKLYLGGHHYEKYYRD